MRSYTRLAKKHNIRMMCENCAHAEKCIVDAAGGSAVHKSRCNVDSVTRSTFGSCLNGKWEPAKYIKSRIDSLEAV